MADSNYTGIVEKLNISTQKKKLKELYLAKQIRVY